MNRTDLAFASETVIRSIIVWIMNDICRFQLYQNFIYQTYETN